jgi:hypothetical protein
VLAIDAVAEDAARMPAAIRAEAQRDFNRDDGEGN